VNLFYLKKYIHLSLKIICQLKRKKSKTKRWILTAFSRTKKLCDLVFLYANDAVRARLVRYLKSTHVAMEQHVVVALLFVSSLLCMRCTRTWKPDTITTAVLNLPRRQQL
jgi:hypothetical protein